MRACLLLLLLWPSAAAAAAGAEPEAVARHVLVVANNVDPTGELPRLRFADDDGARYAELFNAAGARVQLLTTLDAESQRTFPGLAGRSRPPTRQRFDAAVAHLFDDIRHDRAEGRHTEFILVFTGHGRLADGEGQLLLADGPLGRDDLFEQTIAASPADFNHIILDACHAYFLVAARGDWRDDRGGARAQRALAAFLRQPSDLSRHPNTGVIVSTAGTAEVHEWGRLRAGVFSHELRSGLLGPADVDGDGQVCYGELEAFLVAANAGVTHPKARIQVFVQPPLQNLAHPLLDLNAASFTHFLHIPAATAGRFHVEDARGLAYADWNKAPDHPARLALLYPPVRHRPGYTVLRGGQERTYALQPPAAEPQQIAYLAGGQAPAARSRGTVAEAFRRQLFHVPYGAAFAQGFEASRSDQRLSAEQPAPAAAGRAQHALGAGYRLGAPLEPDDPPAHGLEVSYRWLAWEHFHLGARFAWRRTSGGQEGGAHTLDDLSLSVGGGLRWRFGQRWSLGLDLGLGNHWLLYRRDKMIDVDTPQPADKNDASADHFAPGLWLEGGLGLRLFGPLWARLQVGVGMVYGAVNRQEQIRWVPEGSLALVWQFR